MRQWAVGAALIVQACVAHSHTWLKTERAGAIYEVVRTAEFHGRGQSFDKDTLIERVSRAGDDGLEVEYDLPTDAAGRRDPIQWQLPVRVLEPANGPVRLLNTAELEGRRDEWLHKAGIPRELCGHYYFTWNVFRVECNPDSALDLIAAFDLRADLRDDATLVLPGWSKPTVLKRASSGPAGGTFTGREAIDPEEFRRARATRDVIVAEVNRKTLTMDEALRDHATDEVSGVVEITVETDPSGFVRRRTKRITLDYEEPKGWPVHDETTEVVERRLTAGR